MRLINVFRSCTKLGSLKASRFFGRKSRKCSKLHEIPLIVVNWMQSSPICFIGRLPFLGIRNESGQTIELTELCRYINAPKTTDRRLCVIIIAYRAVHTTEWSNVSIRIFTSSCLQEPSHGAFHVFWAVICFRMK